MKKNARFGVLKIRNEVRHGGWAVVFGKGLKPRVEKRG